ncbi:MAG: DUF4249 domain-containing protein [Balneolaceae bacterium]
MKRQQIQQIINGLFILMIGLGMTGCIEEITFDTERSAGQLVVDGGITDQPGPHKLQLSLTSGNNTMREPVRGASVVITDGDGNTEDYIELEDGTYLLMGETVQGERGQSYSVEISLPDGKQYRSVPETIPLAVAKDSSYFELGTVDERQSTGRIVERDAVMIYADTELPDQAEPVYLKWEVESMYGFRETERNNPFNPTQTCNLSQPVEPQKITLFASPDSDTKTIEKNLLGIKEYVSHEFYRPHHFSVIVSSITESRYEYWNQVDEIVNSTGTIFDVPPAVVKGNVFNVDDENEQVFGYFETAVVDTSRFHVLRSDFPFFIPNPCGLNSLYTHDACDRCSELEE